MDNLLSVSPGLIIWTIINFLVFLFIIVKFGTKPILNGLKSREERISGSIEAAEKANENAKKLLAESQDKLQNARQEMNDIIVKGKNLADEHIKKALQEAELVKKAKVEEASREIERSKEAAIKELRKEVAEMVVQATEKILETELDKDKHYKLIENYIDKIPKN